MSSNKETEIQLIQETIENYFRGVIQGTYAMIVQAWHKEGKRLSVAAKTNELIIQNSPASSEYADLTPDPEIRQTALIEVIDRTGSAACVRLKWFLETPQGKSTCTDYLLLLKVKDAWTIVTKVSHKE